MMMTIIFEIIIVLREHYFMKRISHCGKSVEWTMSQYWQSYLFHFSKNEYKEHGTKLTMNISQCSARTV